MPYIPPDGKFSPGNILGDAKTVETRKVPYELTTKGPKYDIAPGDVVYIDESGYAAPYKSAKDDGMPYGVVWRMTQFDPKAPRSSSNTCEVTIVMQGVVAVTCYPQTKEMMPPELGDLVNQYGCKTDGHTKGEFVIGVCDGVGTDPIDTELAVAAVRLTPLISSAVAQSHIQNLQMDIQNLQMDIQNLYDSISALSPEGSSVPVHGVPVWMKYNKVIHFGWAQADDPASGIVLLWKDPGADVVTLGVDPSIPELREWTTGLRVYLACPDGTVITAPMAMEDECCMSLAALHFYQANDCHILKHDCYYTLVIEDHIEAHFQLNELTEEQLKHLMVGEAYTYYFGITMNQVSTMANGYVTLVYDGEYKQSPEP